MFYEVGKACLVAKSGDNVKHINVLTPGALSIAIVALFYQNVNKYGSNKRVKYNFFLLSTK